MTEREDYVTIDDNRYEVPVKYIKISGDALDRYAERTNSGDLQRELIGVYYNYEVVFCSGYRFPDAYRLLWKKITEPIEFHSITLWNEDGPFTFEGYFANPQNEMLRIKGGITYWKSLSVSVVSRKPTRV